MDNSLKGLLLAAGVVITCVVLGLGFYISRQAKNTAMDAIGNVDTMSLEFGESSFTMYDGTSISGTEVLNIVDKYKSYTDFAIKVTNKKDTIYYGMSLNATDTELDTTAGIRSLTNAKNPSNASYINPNSTFKGELFRDANNRIIGIGFTQN